MTHKKFGQIIKGKTVLITGGTGSFGTALVPKLLNNDVAEIRIFSRDEKKQDDMRKSIQDDRVKYYLGDVRDKDSLGVVMSGVNFVFHAAALKQVPSCEFYPLEAVKTNILGAENILGSCINNNVEKVVCLSTDKAVYPINAMGLTKALMEKMAVAASRRQEAGKTVICVTRYGNVLGSRGSVLPLFFKQVRNKEPITVTNADMTRFMMTLDQAVDLVIYAFEKGCPGDIFVQKAPAASIETIVNAIKKIIRDQNYPVNLLGIRHGEKMHESLTSAEEMLVAEDLGDYFRIPSDGRDLNYAKYFERGMLRKDYSDVVGYSSDITNQMDTDQTVSLISSVFETLKY